MTHRIFPEERLYKDKWYPWTGWALGWACIAKAVFWLFSARGLYAAENFPVVMPVKYLVFMLLLLYGSRGVFYFRKWARTLLVVVCVVDPAFYLFVPDFVPPLEHGIGSPAFEWMSGPLGDAIIFILVILSWKHFGRRERYLESEE